MDSSDSLSYEGPIKFNSVWNTLVTLLWKHIRTMWTNWEHFLLTILVPILFCSILVIMRITIAVDTLPVETYSTLDLNSYWVRLMAIIDERKAIITANVSNPFIPEKIVGYAPDILGYGNIMKGASENLQSLGLNSYNTCENLRTAIMKENLFAGVCFVSVPNTGGIGHTDMIDGLYPKHLRYYLIFPYACRIYHDTFIGASWSTNHVFHSVNRTGQRNTGQEDGGYVGYIREGFAPLQNAISLSYMKLVANLKRPDFEMPEILMSRFPSRKAIANDIIDSVSISVSLIFVLGNYYPVLLVAAKIVEEKKSILRRYSNIMGVNNYVHCLAWICSYMLRAFISSFVIVVLFKIKWISGVAILQWSNFFAVLLVIYIFNITSICFIIMLSALYKDAFYTAFGTAVSWFVTYVPYIMSLKQGQSGHWDITIWTVVFHNTTFAFVVDNILDLEIFGDGLGFSNLLDIRHLRRTISVGALLCIMIIQSFMYICIGLYTAEILPNHFGFSKRWNFLFIYKSLSIEISNTNTAFDIATNTRGSAEKARTSNTFIYEIGDITNNVLVEMNNVCKRYGNEEVLKDITLRLYDNQITIILGHNGVGKTTLLKMMCGLSSITSGNIIIEGFDVYTDERNACASLGLCMGKTLLYPNLTVEDQIRYFCYLKGYQNESVESELEYYLMYAELGDCRTKLTRTLPMSELQKLSICCALVGRSRVVLLDDPTTHMDLPARTLVWKLLEHEKSNRTIVITSSSAQLLDSIGDRVIILSNGELQCDGSPEFLKEMYGDGYRLTVAKARRCNIEDVTRYVGKFIPHIVPLNSFANEINYEIQETYFNLLDELTDGLHRNMSSLGIKSIQLRSPNIEDLFFKLADEDDSHTIRQLHRKISSETCSFPAASQHFPFMEIEERVTGIRRTLQHIQATWSRRITYLIHYKFHYINPLTLPSLVVFLTFFVSSFYTNEMPMPALEFSLDQYESSVTMIERRYDVKLYNPIFENYKQLIFWLGIDHVRDDTEGALLSNYYLEKDFTNLQRMDQEYHVGVTIAVNYIIAWFNNVALHSVPISLNMAHNAILRAIYDDECGIEIILEPLNNMKNYEDSQLRTPLSTGYLLPLCISMIVCCIWNTVVFIIIREISSGYDKAQMLAGTTFFRYWSAHFTYDTVVIAVTTFVTTLLILAYQYQWHVDFYLYVWYAIIVMLCGWCVYTLNYMLALFFVNPSHAFTFVLSFETFSILCYFHMVETYENQFVATIKSSYPSYLLLFPLFSFCSAISTIYYNGELRRICSDEHIRFASIHLEKCQAIPNCCHKFHLLSLEDGLLMEIIVMTASTCICWWIIYMSYYRYIWNCIHIPEDNDTAQLNDHYHRHNCRKNYEFAAESTYQEQYKIQIMKKSELNETPLICDRLGKNFGDKVAVERVSLILHRCSSFGILGLNGSGVTTLFNLIAGITARTYGRVLINGRNTDYNPDLVKKMVGYGRQTMIRFPELTVQDTLQHACKLRSYPPQHIDEICVNLAKVFGIYPYYYKHLGYLSLGLLNRLNCAVAVMGNPEIILLDMATAGIDSSGTQDIWNILKCMESKGATILISTISLINSQRYCNRIAFMSNSSLCLIGHPWKLSARIIDHHYLIGKFNYKLPSETTDYLYQQDINKLTEFIYEKYPHSLLKDHHDNNFIFLIPVQCSTISKIYTTFARNANNLDITYFRLLPYLSQSFIEYWRNGL